MKAVIIALSDPKNGSEEALGRVFNALALASECKPKGDEVAVVFNGTGTHWPAELIKLSHPANGLYNSVRDVVQGASCGCAEDFGATGSIKSCGVPMVKDDALAGTTDGIPSCFEPHIMWPVCADSIVSCRLRVGRSPTAHTT